MKKLVVFYSRAGENYFEGTMKYISVGNTEKVANIIADILDADLFKLEPKKPYASDYSTCIQEAKKDLQTNARPELVALPNNLEQYNEIYLGYPNYWGTMPMAVYSFLEAFDFSKKTIYPFCTHEGSGLSSTEKDIARIAKNSNVAKGIAISGSLVDNSKEMIERWLKNEF